MICSKVLLSLFCMVCCYMNVAIFFANSCNYDNIYNGVVFVILLGFLLGLSASFLPDLFIRLLFYVW